MEHDTKPLAIHPTTLEEGEFLLDNVKLFIHNKGIVLTRTQIVDKVWGCDADILDRTIDTYIKNLRKKLDIDCIATVKGVGCRMEKE